MSADVVVKPARFPSFLLVEEPVPAPRVRSTAEQTDAVLAAARREGVARGREEGRTEALAAWAGRLTALAAALEEAIGAARAERERLAAELVDVVPRVAIQLAEKVIERELADRGSAVRTAVDAVVRRAVRGGAVTIRVAPDIAEALGAWRADDQRAAALVDAPIVADAALRPGEWMVESEHGLLDGRLATQLEEAARILTGADA